MVTPTVRTALLGAGDRPNQDRILVTENAVAVLDGASDPNEPPHLDGGVHADALCAELRVGLETRSPLTDVVATAIAKVATRLSLTTGEAPSSTVAIARWSSDAVETYLLGDSTITMIGRDSREHRTTDLRLVQLATQQRQAYVTLLQQGGGFSDEHQAILAELRAEQRHQRNRPSGYWIAEAAPAAASHAIQRSWSRGDVRYLVLATDGTAAGVDDYGVMPGWTSFAFAAERDHLSYSLRLIHDLETRDPEGRRWPRAKMHDDKAIAVISFP